MSADTRIDGLEFVDIGVNLTDGMYDGVYRGKLLHPSDLDSVLERAREAGVSKQIVTAGSVHDVKDVLELIGKHRDLYATAGVHPTRTSQVSDGYLDDLRKSLDQHALQLPASDQGDERRIVAIGECGLDYDRLHFSDKDVQKKHFAKQLTLALEYKLPLFLHCRAAQDDFLTILGERSDEIAKANDAERSQSDPHRRKRIGVAHCFTGSVAEMHQLLDAGLFVGLTGCSFKEEEGIAVAKAVPLERLLLETDAPWCDMRPTHASAPLLTAFGKAHPERLALFLPQAIKKEKWSPDHAVKGRNEPCTMGAVAAVVAQAKGVDFATVVQAVRDNTRFLFGI